MRRGAAVLAFLLAAPGCSGVPLDLWPLVVQDRRPVAGVRATRIAGPFFERWERDDGESGWTLRPLLARVQTGSAAEWELLYPLAGLRRDAEGDRLRVTPFVDHTVRKAGGAGTPEAGSRGWSFLFAFGGRSASGERYGGVFPFGGVLRDRFGLERLDFILFPLFARARHPSGFERTFVLWPFLSFGSGGGRRLVKLWPFYGSDVREGEFERRYALWPLVHWGRERIGSGGETRTRLFLPFYGESVAAHARSRFVLGPLYLHAENDRTGAHATDVLWPFLRFAEEPGPEGGPGVREIRVEPLFALRTAPGATRLGALLGTFETFDVERPPVRHRGLRMLFVSRFERLEEAGRETRVRRDLWPFASFRMDVVEGREQGRLLVPWLLPLRGEGWSRHALGVTTFYERRWRGEESRNDVLWGLLRRRTAPDYRLDAVSWLVRREEFAGEDRRWSLFGAPLP